MTEIEPIDLKQRMGMPTGKFLLLTVATAGFYAFYWLFKNTPIIAAAGRRDVATETFLLVLVGLMGWGDILMAGDGEGIVMAGLVLVLAGSVMTIVWAFRAKSALMSYAAATYGIDYRMNSFYTFIFSYFYINYCINEIPEEQARLQAFVNRVPAV